MMNMNMLEDLLTSLNKKEDEKTEECSSLGVGYHRSSGSSSRNRLCSVPFLCTGLSGRF